MRKLFVVMALALLAPQYVYAAQQTWISGDQLSDIRTKLSGNDTDLYGQAATKWVTATAYTANNQMVSHNGHVFVCTSNHTSGATTEPGVGASWATVWKYHGADLYEPLKGEDENYVTDNEKIAIGNLPTDTTSELSGKLATDGTAADSAKLGGVEAEFYQLSLGTAGAAGFYPLEESVLGLTGKGALGNWKMFYSNGAGGNFEEFDIGNAGYALVSQGTAGPPQWLIRPQTITCTGTDKVSGFDITTGLFSCTADIEGEGGTGIAHATSDGNYYASRNGAWASLTGLYLAAGGTAANSSLLENHAASYFQIALTNPLVRTDIDDTPVNGEVTGPISSNWAYDHAAAADPHIGYALESALGTASSRNAEDTLTDGSNLPDGAAIKAYGDANWGGGSLPDGTATNQLLQWDGDSWEPVATIAGIGDMDGGAYNNVTITPPATGATLTLANGSTLATSGAYSLTQTLTGNSNVTFPTTGTLATLSDIPTGTLPDGTVIGQTIEWDGDSWEPVGTVTITPGTGITINLGEISVTANTYQPLDSDLTTWAGITPGTGVATFLATPSTTNFFSALTDEGAFAATLFGYADASAARTGLSLVPGTNVQAYDADLDDLADGSLTASKVGDGLYVADDCTTVSTPATGAICFEY